MIAGLLQGAGTLDIYFADVEGTRAMLVTTALGEALLLDSGEAEDRQTVRKSPGLEDIWQMHYTVDVGDANNAPDKFIANPQKEPDSKCFGTVLGDQAKWIKVSAQSDGAFTVTNSRNGHSKTYRRRG